jgi:signal transduction histidine kinase
MASRDAKRAVDKAATPAAPIAATPPEPSESSVQLTNPRYDVSFEYAIDCQVLTDSQGVILNVNLAGTKFLQRDKAFLLGKPLGLLLRSESPSPFYHYLGRLAQGSGGPFTFETRLISLPGQQRHILVMGMSDPPSMIRWVLHDTTLWRQAESARVVLLRKLITVQEEERRKLSRDLHDNIGQLLTGLTLALGGLEQAPLEPKYQRALALAQRVATELRQVVHDISHGLRSSLLDESGLHAALQQLTSEWELNDAAVKLKFEAEDVDGVRLPREVEAIVFSLVQEALTNVYRHARARRALVRIQRTPAELVVLVQDNGIGFDPLFVAHQSGLGRLGLVGMRERAELLGGTLKVESIQGRGTTLTARIPIPAVALDESPQDA